MTSYKLLSAIVKNGHLEALIWFYKKYRVAKHKSFDILILAAENGHFHICRWLLSLPKSYRIDPAANDNEAIKFAIENGHLDLCKWLLSLPKYYGIDPGYYHIKYIFRQAVKIGDLDLCKWLLSLPERFKINPAANDNEAFAISIEMDHIDIREWLLSLPTEKYGIDFPTEVTWGFIRAASTGNLYFCKCLWRSIDYPSETFDPTSAFYWSISNGHLKTSKWLFDILSTEGYQLTEEFESEYIVKALKLVKEEHKDIRKWLLTLSEKYGIDFMPG